MDFLASFNFRDEEPSRVDSQPHASIEELQSQLRDVFSGKVSETRAERVATRLDLAAAAELTLGVSEGDSHTLEGLSTLDPSLGGAQSTGVSEESGGERTVRVVRVSDALLSQPADDPVLQRSIANHIVAAVGQVDGSEWVVREVSRATQDWAFSYVCKGSMQHWQRQHKSQVKPLVADYSQREIDPLLASRPAFDCRGSLVISFSRNSRAIFIDYDHIPLHRTVAQLATLFKPPPPRRPLPTVDKQPKTPSSSRKKRDADKTPVGEGSKARKRKRKPDDAGAPGEQGVLNSQEAAAVQASQLQSEEESSSSLGQQQHAQDGTAAAQNSAAGLLTINVSPEEAERRRNVAIVMLQGAGVDPDSLSPEQFNIFANQSPELQKESLNMLVKYGAERLRIVHPGNKEGSAPPSTSNPSSAPATQSNIQGSLSGPVTTNELVLQTPTPANKKKSRRNSQVANDVGEEANAGLDASGSPKKSRRRGTGKSRNACAQCKQRRVKCPRETPICSGCREAGLICEYAAPKPKKMKSNAIITREDEQDGQDEDEQDETRAELHDGIPPEDQQLHEDAEGYPDLPDDSVHHQMPIGDALASNMASTATDWEQSHVPHNYFHHTNMGVSEAGSSQPSQQSSVPLSDLVPPQGRQYYSNVPSSEVQNQTQTLTQPMAHEHRKKPTKSSAKGSGRNAAMRTSNQDDNHSSLNPTAASDWSNSGNPVTQAAAVVAAVVTSMQNQTSHESTYGIADSPDRSSDWRSAAMPQALENSQQQNVAAASLQRSGAVSPMNAVSRAASSPRTGKHQKRGAIHETSTTDAFQSPNMSDPKQQQQQSNAHGQGLQAPAAMAGSGTYNSYDRYSSTRAPEASSTDRITYEPYSYQRDATNATPYTNYSHGSHAATTTTTAASMQAATTVSADRAGPQTYSSYANPTSRNTSHTNQTSHMGSRGNAQTQDFSNNNSDLTRNSRQNFNSRSQSSTPRPNQNAAKQDRNYPAYSSQMQQQQQQNAHHRVAQQQPPQHTQQPSQHQAWYGFNNQSGSGFAATTGHGSNYSWNMPGDS
ncbi:hypothetical protein GGI35DRAFT_465698 [Trichoderma velutinum]